jgi:hypothetical protein
MNGEAASREGVHEHVVVIPRDTAAHRQWRKMVPPRPCPLPVPLCCAPLPCHRSPLSPAVAPRAPLTGARPLQAAAAAACALVAVAGVVGRDGGRGDAGASAMLQMEELRLQGAALPSYSPAAVALAKSQKEVRSIVEHEAQRKKAAAAGVVGKSDTAMAGGTSLTKKQLAKIVSSARAAAEKNNALIYAADGALAASQKELGKDAVKVSTLSTASDDMGHTFNSLIDLAASDKSKTTQAALQAATAAAAKDRREMANAANILKVS